MSEPADCIVAGHICLDIAPQMYAGGSTISEIFRPGKLINVGPATVSTGGSVSNTGLPLRRLGINVQLMGKCGEAVFGRALVDAIRQEAPGAEAGMQVVAGEKTSYSVVINPRGIDRMFLHCPGANDTFTADDIDLELVRVARLFHFGYPPLMARMYGQAGKQLVELLHQAKTAGATTSLDMALPDPAGPSGKVDWKSILNASLPHVDIFTPSVEELTFMLRRKTFDELLARAGDAELLGLVDGELLCDAANQCIDAGAAIVLIKCGYHGLYVRTAGRGRLERLGRCGPGDLNAWTNRELFEPSYAVETVVSATGAGDCAIAGFLAAFLRGCNVEDAMRYGCAVGAQNVRAADAVSGVLSWDQTVRQVASRPARNDVTIPLARWRYDESQGHYRGPRDGKS